jgi:hypothetical protein
MKSIIKSNYVDVSIIPAALFGIGYSQEVLTVFIGPILFEIKAFGFKRKPKPTSGFEI